MGEESMIMKRRLFEGGLRILAYVLIFYGLIGLILVRVGFWG